MDLIVTEAPPLPLSQSVRDLMVEASAEGFDWIGHLEAAWAERPFDQSGEGLFLAWKGHRLVGMAGVTEDHYLRDGLTGRLRFVYVPPTYRGYGVADTLTSHCLARAKARWRVIRLHTENPVAARLYVKYGFVPLLRPDAEATHVIEVV